MIYTYIYIHCEYVLNDFIDRGIWAKTLRPQPDTVKEAGSSLS